jgi:hypothetical protein
VPPAHDERRAHALLLTKPLLVTKPQHKHSTLCHLFATSAAREHCAELAADVESVDVAWNAMMTQVLLN